MGEVLMSKKLFDELIVVLVICVCMTIVFAIWYSTKLADAKELHYNKEKFLPVDVYGYQIRKYTIENEDGSYSTVYDAKYEYEVDGNPYCFYSYKDSSVSSKFIIYYNPSNPQEYSYYATYKDAIKPVNYIRIIGYLFFGASVFLLLIIIYVRIFKKEYIYNDNYIIADDNITLDKYNNSDDNISSEKEYILDEYGLWVDDENYVDVDTRLNRAVIPVPDKEVVDKIATIPFKRKNSSENLDNTENINDIENIDNNENTNLTEDNDTII
ncbi:MAG: hypothetical protein E7257_05525 [Lachnospiraceae bacterium]|nr:hypothetical protein [Lachnospiraceae bacterium]